MLETYRELLQDHFDLPALRELLSRLQTREISLVAVETAEASPFAQSLAFDFVARAMYEDDTPAAERRMQALTLDRDLLRELLGADELRDLLDPEALASVEHDLAARSGPRRGRAARPAAAIGRSDPRASSPTVGTTSRRPPSSCSASAGRSASGSRARTG